MNSQIRRLRDWPWCRNPLSITIWFRRTDGEIKQIPAELPGDYREPTLSDLLRDAAK